MPDDAQHGLRFFDYLLLGLQCVSAVDAQKLRRAHNSSDLSAKNAHDSARVAERGSTRGVKLHT